MESVLIFEFERCVEIFLSKKPISVRDFCFRPLPDAHFVPGSLDMIKTARAFDITTVLVAYSDEVLVKESLLKLDACLLFDDILILDELVPGFTHPRKTAREFLHKKYGNNFRFVTDFSKNLV